MNLRELPDLSDAYKQVLDLEEKKKSKEPRWQDDDCDGKWYEKSDVDGKTSKREKKAKEMAYKAEGNQRNPEGSIKDRFKSKQTDPSKDGFTGIGDSIADIMKQNAAMKKKAKKEEVDLEEAERTKASRLERKRKLYDKTTRKAMDDARNTGEASGHNRYRMGSINREYEALRDRKEGYQRDPEHQEKERKTSKQTDPSKDGFTGIGNSIDDIMKQNAAMKKAAAAKKVKKEEKELSENPIQKAWNWFVPSPENSANPNVRSGKLKPGSLEGPLLDKMNKGAAAVNAPIKAVSKAVQDPMGALKNAPPLAKAGLVGAAALGTKAVVDKVMGHGKNSNEGFEFVNKLIESGQFSEEEIVRIIEASAE